MPETCQHQGWKHCMCYLCRVACAQGAPPHERVSLGVVTFEPNVQESEHGPDWSDWGLDHPEESPSCRCGFNGTPEECAATRSTEQGAG